MHTKPKELQFESHFAELDGGDRLHLRRIYNDPKGEPVFLVHGMLENGHIFYTNSGKGYASYLAQNGYDVFVADLRGRGYSTPRVNRHSEFGHKEMLTEDMPAYLAKIQELKGEQPMHWGAHSWGGVSLLAYLAIANPQPPVKSIVFFGAKRRISVRNWYFFWMIRVSWWHIFPLLIKLKGFIPAKDYKLGGENESRGVFYQTDYWVREKEWKHWDTGWDFAKALQGKPLPPVLYLAGKKDRVLGHPTDVQLLAEETGDQIRTFHMLSKENGHQIDYGHINMLTHPQAVQDVFPIALEWMNGKYKGRDWSDGINPAQ